MMICLSSPASERGKAAGIRGWDHTLRDQKDLKLTECSGGKGHQGKRQCDDLHW